MLQSIRNNVQGIFVWVIVVLIIVSFALFGLGSYLSGASKVVSASVNGVDISSTQLTRAYQNYQERLRQMFGEQYRPEMFNEATLKNEVLSGLIKQEVMNQMMHEKGYRAADQQVFEKIRQYQAFFEENGEFSPERYKEVLALQGLNGEAFERDLARGIATQQIQSAISQSAFLTTKENKNLAALENQKRNIGYFEISADPYRKSIKVSDEDIQADYEKNRQLYLTTEKVKLEYLELNMDELAAAQEVSEDMMKEHYESRPESYMANDNVAAKKKASDLRQKVISGANFSDLAKEFSDDKGSAKQGGDLGYLTRGVEENFDKVVFALKKGEVSKVIKSKDGFQIIQLDDIRSGDPEERKVRHILIKAENKLKAYADVKTEIKKELQYQLAGKVFFDDSDQMNNLSYESPDSLEPVAEALGLKIKTTAAISRRGATGILSNPKVINAAFSQEVLKEGRNSELLELSDTQLVVLRIKEHQPSTVQPLAQVKPAIKNKLLQQQASEQVQQVTTEILTRVKNAESIADIKKRYSEVKWNKPAWITRKADKDSKLSSQVRQQAFSMPKPEDSKVIWDKANLSAGSQAVIALYKVEVPKDASANETSLAQVLGQTDYESFVEHLKSQADISISQAAIDSDAGQQ